MDYSLYLYPLQPLGLAASDLQKKLEQMAFATPGETPESCLPGANLMDYITFLGCSPALQRGEIESIIRLHSADKAFAMGGESVVTLRYPGCQHKIDNAPAIIEHFDQPWRCPQCDNSGDFNDINWRKSAAVASLFIEITAVFPKEAVPSDKLLEQLKQTSDADWSWFYSRSQSL